MLTLLAGPHRRARLVLLLPPLVLLRHPQRRGGFRPKKHWKTFKFNSCCEHMAVALVLGWWNCDLTAFVENVSTKMSKILSKWWSIYLVSLCFSADWSVWSSMDLQIAAQHIWWLYISRWSRHRPHGNTSTTLLWKCVLYIYIQYIYKNYNNYEMISAQAHIHIHSIPSSNINNRSVKTSKNMMNTSSETWKIYKSTTNISWEYHATHPLPQFHQIV